MKKLIAIILSLVMLLSMAACAPNEGPTEPATDAPTEKPTEKPTEAPTNAPTDPEPTDPPAPTDPEPTDPPTLQDAGYCAVGIVDAEAGTAKILADNGVVEEISYTSEEKIVAGNIYAFAKEGDVYVLTVPAYVNPDGAWGVRTYDNAGAGYEDTLYTNDGMYGRHYHLDENSVVFIRYSETEWRVYKGTDIIGLSDYPCWMQFASYLEGEEVPEGSDIYNAGTVLVMFVAGDPSRNKVHADDVQSSFFDYEGYGWPDGDLIIE